MQGCLNALVLQKQQQLARGPLVGASCSTVSPNSLQACLNSFALALQRSSIASNSRHNSSNNNQMCGPFDQACMNNYVINNLQKEPGMVGGCGGVSPDNKQVCINNYLLSLQDKRHASMAAAAAAVAAAGSTSVTTTTTTTVVQKEDSVAAAAAAGGVGSVSATHA
jgi:hypothetical protein